MILGVSAEQEELRASVRRFLADRAPLSRVRELDINPLVVRPAGQGAVALDALVVPTATVEHSPDHRS